MAVKNEGTQVPVQPTVENDTKSEIEAILGESVEWSDGKPEEPVESAEDLVDMLLDKEDESEDDDSSDPDVDEAEEKEEKDSDEDAPEDEELSEEDIEYVPANGKKVKVDFKNRDHIKKTYALAALARPMQARADKAVAELESLKSETAEDTEILNRLDELVEAGDDEGIYRLVTGGKNLVDLFEQWQEEQGKLSEMSPEELEAYKDRQEVERRKTELERREAAIAAREREAESKLSKSELQEQQSWVNSAFNKQRFAGTLGDKAREQRLDNMVFNSVKATLASMKAVSPELINEVIKHEFDAIRGTLDKTVEKKASKVIKKVKNKATREAQEAATGKKSKKPKQEEINPDDLLSGSLEDIMENMTKYLAS